MIDDLFETLAEVLGSKPPEPKPKPKPKPEPKRVCAECGSDKVERMVWADVNTGEFHGDAGDGAVYCLACDQNVKLKDAELEAPCQGCEEPVPVSEAYGDPDTEWFCSDCYLPAKDKEIAPYHIVEVGCSYVGLPAEWLVECDLVRSDLTREEVVRWEGLSPDRIGSGATVLDHKTPDDLREHMRAGDIGSLHVIVSLINDAWDEGYLKDGVVARLLGGA